MYLEDIKNIDEIYLVIKFDDIFGTKNLFNIKKNLIIKR
jgi:hypothetical protein